MLNPGTQPKRWGSTDAQITYKIRVANRRTAECRCRHPRPLKEGLNLAKKSIL